MLSVSNSDVLNEDVSDKFNPSSIDTELATIDIEMRRGLILDSESNDPYSVAVLVKENNWLDVCESDVLAEFVACADKGDISAVRTFELCGSSETVLSESSVIVRVTSLECKSWRNV